MKTKKYFDVADQVRYKREFLNLIDPQFRSPFLNLKGVVTDILDETKHYQLVRVEWYDGTWCHILSSNIERG